MWLLYFALIRFAIAAATSGTVNECRQSEFVSVFGSNGKDFADISTIVHDVDSGGDLAVGGKATVNDVSVGFAYVLTSESCTVSTLLGRIFFILSVLLYTK